MMEFVEMDRPIGRAEFDTRLRTWAATTRTDADVVGDVDPPNQKRTPWIWVRDAVGVAKLHADTCASGVRRYLALVDQHAGRLTWTIVRSRKGRLTKVAFGPEQEVIEGFYLYVPERED